jgi:hypothetical protein
MSSPGWMLFLMDVNNFFQKGTGPAHNPKAAMEQCLTDLLEPWSKEVWSLDSPAFNSLDD